MRRDPTDPSLTQAALALQIERARRKEQGLESDEDDEDCSLHDLALGDIHMSEQVVMDDGKDPALYGYQGRSAPTSTSKGLFCN